MNTEQAKPLAVGGRLHGALWEAINDYATACGGNPDGYVYGNLMRQKAVAEVERVVAAAAESADAPKHADPRSLERLVSLHARWLAMADTMEELALDSTDDSPDQLECYERMRTLRDCASLLDDILRAGMEANR